MITEDKVTELFCVADDFCKEFNSEIKKNAILPSTDGIKRRHRARRMSDAEIITIIMAFHNFIMNLLAALGAYFFFDNKPAVNFDFEIEESNGQLVLFQ